MCGLRTCPGLWRSFHIPTPAFCRLCMYVYMRVCEKKFVSLSLFLSLSLSVRPCAQRRCYTRQGVVLTDPQSLLDCQ